MRDIAMQEIIDRIKSLRKKHELSYQQLADKTGMSKSTLQRYESGDIANIPLSRVQTLADALHTTPAYIMGWDEEEPPAGAESVLGTVTEAYGQDVAEVVRLYIQLDVDDQGEVRGEMKQMLKADKYAAQKASLGGTAI